MGFCATPPIWFWINVQVVVADGPLATHPDVRIGNGPALEVGGNGPALHMEGGMSI